ncbi:hypothetical protein AB0I69_46550 [Streptomyces sp. NPDC050508]|uniref:hypothetical protein n=1 Tax=Streptomyces sp. NPDC050508 TaxID=3155405 RepID=UPI0034159702
MPDDRRPATRRHLHGHDLEKLAKYLSEKSGKLAYKDTKSGATVDYDGSLGALVVENSYMIHAYQYDAKRFKELIDEGRYILQKPGS